MQTLHSEETSEARATRLEQMREHARHSQNCGSRFDDIVGDDVACPVFGKSIQEKMKKFHSKLANCSFYECATCSESFPTLKVPRTNE